MYGPYKREVEKLRSAGQRERSRIRIRPTMISPATKSKQIRLLAIYRSVAFDKCDCRGLAGN
jgi:hypothetical protein